MSQSTSATGEMSGKGSVFGDIKIVEYSSSDAKNMTSAEKTTAERDNLSKCF